MKFVKCIQRNHGYLIFNKVYKVDKEIRTFYDINGYSYFKGRFKILEGNERILKILYESK
jgi:hypothetical protein